MRLIGRREPVAAETPGDVRALERVNGLFTWVGMALLVIGLWTDRTSLLAGALLCLLPILVNDHRQLAYFARHRGVSFLLAVLPLALLRYATHALAVFVGWLLGHVLGEPSPDATVQAFAEVGVRTWPPVPAQRVNVH
jgi:hypothetical protein